jgi:hypothetical protein
LTAAELARLGVDSPERRKETLDAVKKYRISQSNTTVSGASTSKGKDSATSGTYDIDDEAKEVKERQENDQIQERALDVDERRRAALTTLQEKFGKGSKV